MFDFRIETFLKVCETLNYTKAAEELRITQPAVSQHIHFLEGEYGVRFFLQEGKKIKLTKAGEMMLRSVRTFRNDEQVLRKKLRDTGEGEPPFLFGATVTIGEFSMMDPLAEYLRQNPDREVHLTVADTAALTQALRDGRIQAAVIEGFFNSDEFGSQILKKERFIAVASSQHHFERKPEKLQDLFPERLILREMGSGTRQILEKNLELQNLKVDSFHGKIEINSMYAIVQLLKKDAGISFLYEAAVRKEIREGILAEIPLSDFKVKHDFTLIWNKNSIYEKEYQKIRTFLNV